MEALTVLLALTTLASLALAIFVLFRRAPKTNESAMQLLQSQVAQLSQQLNERMKETTGTLNSTQAAVGQRLDNATAVVGLIERKLGQLEAAADAVLQAERVHHLPMPVSVSTGFMPAVFRWASGEDDWSGIVEESFGGHEGDLIRAMRRLIDVLRQLSEAAEVEPALAALLSRAARVVDRGIVLESALI